MAWKVQIIIPSIGGEYVARITHDPKHVPFPPQVVETDTSAQITIGCRYKVAATNGASPVDWRLGIIRTGYKPRSLTVRAIVGGTEKAKDTKQIEDGSPGGGGGRRTAILANMSLIPEEVLMRLWVPPVKAKGKKTAIRVKRK